MTKERRGMFHLDVLIEKENNHYTAHCLQFDLVADGKTKESAKKNIMDVIVEYICFAYRNNWEKFVFKPAPQEYWEKLCCSRPESPERIERKIKGVPLKRLIEEVDFNRVVTYA
ncbi:MAG: hypothetical protein KKG06_04350 [Bacteroidetes bacterium]|nr:hypothetical protein [bacterium]MBU1422404.1 hypothetical protein [Bacteroidota bacterium]